MNRSWSKVSDKGDCDGSASARIARGKGPTTRFFGAAAAEVTGLQ